MIVRILGEGQWTVDESEIDELNRLDDAVVATLDGDEHGFGQALDALLGRIRSVGARLDDAELLSSDAVLPGPDATPAEVRAMLAEDGLIPG